MSQPSERTRKNSTGSMLGRVLPVRTRLPLLITAVGALASALIIATAPANTPTARHEKVWPVTVSLAERADLSPEILLFGRIETPRTAELGVPSSFVTGNAQVAEVLVKEGEWVKEDQTLLRLDDRDARLELRQREAELANTRAKLASVRVQHEVDKTALESHRQLAAISREKLDRQEKLRQQNMVADASLDDARREAQLQAIALGDVSGRVSDHPNELERHRAELALAETQLELARLQLDRTEVRAPFAGRIASVGVARGERVVPGEPVIEIYDATALEVRAQIPSQQVAAVRRALAAQRETGGPSVAAHAVLDGVPIALQLDRLSGRVAAGRGGVDGLFKLQSEGTELELGRVVDLYVTMPREPDVVAVPIQAIYDDTRIYVVEQDRLRAVEVERVGERRAAAGDYEVIVRAPELLSGDSILVTQLPKASEGLKVSAIPRPASTASELDLPRDRAQERLSHLSAGR